MRACSCPRQPGRARRWQRFCGRSTGSSPRRCGKGATRLRLAAEGALLRRREEPACPAEGDRRGDQRRDPHRRHSAEGAPGDAAHATGRADHDARVALPDAHVARARVPGRDGLGDRRRDPRCGPHQARRAPGAHARAARAGGRAAASADRPVRHPASARGGGALPRGGRPELPDRRRGHPQAARPEDPRAGRAHDRAGRARRDGSGRGRHGHRGGRRRPGRRGHRRHRPGRHLALDLAGDLSGAARPDPAAPVDDRVREQPPRRGAARRAAERAGGGAGWRRRA